MLKCDFVSVSVFDTSYQLLSAVNYPLPEDFW